MFTVTLPAAETQRQTTGLDRTCCTEGTVGTGRTGSTVGTGAAGGAVVAGGAGVQVAAALQLLQAGIEQLAGVIRSGGLALEPDTVVVDAQAELRVIGDRLTGLRLTLLPIMDTAGVFSTTRFRNLATFLAGTNNIPKNEADREVTLARTLRDDLPDTRDAIVRGELPLACAKRIVKIATTDARRDALTSIFDGYQTDDGAPLTGERWLIGLAPQLGFTRFATVCARYAHAADPAADDRGYIEATQRAHLYLSQVGDMWDIRGQLTLDAGALLNSALTAITGVPAQDDTRDPAQRRAAALTELAQTVLSNGLVGTTGATVRPHISVTVTFDEFLNQLRRTGINPTNELLNQWDPTGALVKGRTPAILEGSTGPIPDTVLKKIACDSEITRIIFGPDSQILNVGRAKRTITGQLRRAIVARDQHCVWPGCFEPPQKCEVHHAIRHWFEHNGETSTENAALLCWHHHTQVDTKHIQMHHQPLKGWQFTQAA